MNKRFITFILLGSLALASCNNVSQPEQVESLNKVPLADSETSPTVRPTFNISDQPYDRTERPPVAPPSQFSGQVLGTNMPHVGKARRFPNPSSTTVVGDTGGDADVYKEGTIEINIPIRRYVGDKNKAIANGTLSSMTKVTFPIYDVDSKDPTCPEINVAYLNNYRIGEVNGDNNVWTMQELTIPTEKLNFPASPETEANNTFKLKIDTNRCNTWSAEID